MARRTTPIIDSALTLRRILQMEASGMSRKEIARDLDVDYARLCIELKNAGHPGQPGIRKTPLTENQIAEGTRLVVEEGLTYSRAAARIGVETALLRRDLYDRGVRVGRRVKLTDADVEEAARLRSQGWHMTEIAKKFDVTAPTISTRLERHTSGALQAGQHTEDASAA